MIQDSESAEYLSRLGERFMSAVTTSFAFLEQEGFAACLPTEIDRNELRDAAFVCTYVSENTSIDVRLEVISRQICVVVFTYDSEAHCSQTQTPRRVTDLDQWTEEHGPIAPPPLAWMKTQTLHREVARNFRRFFKQVDQNFEDVVEFMAKRLQNAGIAHVREE
jgi:hypothetical protein